jgi:hypothetical protein
LTRSIALLAPTSASSEGSGLICRWRRSTCRASWRRSAAARTRINSSSLKNGFWTKSTAPSFIASTAVSTVPKPVMMMKDASTPASRSFRSTSMPESPGIRMSDRTTSNPPAFAASNASSPVLATCTV